MNACIDGRRCIDNRLYEKEGTWLGFYAKHDKVTFSSIRIEPIHPM